MLSLGKNKKVVPGVDTEEKEIVLFSGLDEMWQYNWKRFNQTSDLEWLIKYEEDMDYYVSLDSVEKEELLPFETLDAQFLVLMDEWFELTKAHSNRSELYTLMRKAIIARNRYINGDKFQINIVRKYEGMIKDLTDNSTGWDPDKELMALSVQAKFLIDEKNITVVKYQKMIEVISEMNKPNTTQNGENI